MTVMQHKLEPGDYVTVKPLDKAEFVIQIMRISELNEAWQGKPAMIFILDPHDPSKEGAITISADEYKRLKYILTGELDVAPEELKEAYVKATASKKKPAKSKKKEALLT